MDRREFLACSGLSLLSAATPAAFAAPPRRLRLGFQVYAVRDLCARDFVGTLRAVKALGYEGVETGRFYGRNPTVHVMPAIDDFRGLKPGEAGLGSVRDKADWPRILAALRHNGTEWLVVKPTAFPDNLSDLRACRDYLTSQAAR